MTHINASPVRARYRPDVKKSLALVLCVAALLFAGPAASAERAKNRNDPRTPAPAHAVPRHPAPALPHHVAPPRPGVTWTHGYWHHGWYGGRLGWWWVVGPRWTYYYGPVWPYWDPYPPREVIVVEQPQPTGPPPAAYWYRCDDPQGFYPYVASCPGGWTPVPATPPPESGPRP